MKFKIKAADLNAALEIVSIVTPTPVTPQEGAGYLFVVNNGEKASVYSRDNTHVVRYEVPITDVEGEGSFVYPSNYVDAFKFLGDQDVVFEYVESEGSYKVSYSTESGASAEHSSFDPKLMMTKTDKELSEATSECSFPVAILRDALSMGRAFTAKPNDSRGAAQEALKTLQVFDASVEDWKSGDGYMFGADGVRAFFFYSDAFKGKKLSLHSSHLPFVNAFLAKCEGDVTFKTAQSYTFAVDSKGNVLGWSHQTANHGKFRYYGLKGDNFVLRVGKMAFLNALKHTRSELDKKKDKVRFHFTHEPEPRIHFTASDSSSKSNSFFIPVAVVDNGEKSMAQTRGFSIGVNLDHLIDLIADARSNEVEMRVMLAPVKEDGKERAVLRTIDSFRVTRDGKTVIAADDKEKEVIECTVTRFMPSKE